MKFIIVEPFCFMFSLAYFVKVFGNQILHPTIKFSSFPTPTSTRNEVNPRHNHLATIKPDEKTPPVNLLTRVVDMSSPLACNYVNRAIVCFT